VLCGARQRRAALGSAGLTLAPILFTKASKLALYNFSHPESNRLHGETGEICPTIQSGRLGHTLVFACIID